MGMMARPSGCRTIFRRSDGVSFAASCTVVKTHAGVGTLLPSQSSTSSRVTPAIRANSVAVNDAFSISARTADGATAAKPRGTAKLASERSASTSVSRASSMSWIVAPDAHGLAINRQRKRLRKTQIQPACGLSILPQPYRRCPVFIVFPQKAKARRQMSPGPPKPLQKQPSV